MPLLFMDAGCELSSPCGSLSAEEYSSSTSALERDGEGNQPRPRVTKRREKNRDAARKSRRKQTERADELHEELQSLEQSNSALQKEIAKLKKDLRLYETALERHKPHCRLKDAASSLADLKTSSAPLQDSSSLNTRVGLKAVSDPEKTRLPSSSSSQAAAASAASSAKLPVTSSSSTSPYCASFSTHPAPHSLFCELPPSFVPPTAAQLLTNNANTTASASQSSSFTDDSFSRTLSSSFAAAPAVHSSSALPKQSTPRNLPQFPPCRFGGSSAATLVTSPPAAPLASIDGYDHQVSPAPESLLSLLTVPSPLNHCQTSFNAPAPAGSKDMSLSELLEVNEWILSGFGNQ
ncbi:PREDICTED: basic leucine zipper transcriptional factor ATF-like 2 [Poecilia mexicana]|uniref:basic leucine zipper transcriptional factor ATF-like 2 n=1 Tax=Poecilia mexicana TaxID=48701 RepID=UPI00072E91FB|nr:PREDICTED: basic leucine zipper transcriptional factor ATF-like 2 [Poecilia mexicana]